MSSLCIAAKTKEGERRFLGRTQQGHYLWTKNAGYIIHFPDFNAVTEFWTKMKPEFTEEFMNEIDRKTISAGNIDYKSIIYLKG